MRGPYAAFLFASCRPSADLRPVLGPLLARARPFGCATVYKCVRGRRWCALRARPMSGSDRPRRSTTDATSPAPGWTLAALLLSAVAAARSVAISGRDLNFFRDEWNFIVQRQANDLDAFLQPHNEHIALVPVLVYKAFFHLFGLEHYWPYQTLVLALHLLCALMLFLVARKRVGAELALVPAVLLLFLGPGFEVILWPFEISFLIPLAAGLGVLLAIDEDTPRHDLLAGALLALALASGSLGIPVAAGATVFLLFDDHRWRRLARIVAWPAAVYALWFVGYHGRAVDPLDNLRSAPRFVFDSVGANLASVFSLDESLGWALALALGLVILARFVLAPAHSRWLLAIVVMMICHWGLTGLFRPYSFPPPSRYLYPGTVFLCLVAIELGRGVRLRWPALILVYGVTLLAVVSNITELESGADRLRRYSDFVGSGAGALELASQDVAPDFRPEPLLAPAIVASEYLSAVRQFGSPALSPEKIGGRSEEVKRASDAVLERAFALHLEPARLPIRTGPVPVLVNVVGGMPTRRAGCAAFEARGGTGSAELPLPRAGVGVRAGPGAPVRIRLRRFAGGYGPDDEAPGVFPELAALTVFGVGMLPPAVLDLPAGGVGRLRVPSADASGRWHVRIATAGSVVVCSLPDGHV